MVAPRLAAQGTTATILGTVTDSTGAAIPGAAIQVKNVGTGLTQSTQSDPQGRYRVSDLAVGDYEAQSSKQGFATVLRKGITLTVGSQGVVDFALAVGQTQQTVTVEGQVTQVETTNSSVGQLVDTAQMRNLPLNGRNTLSLVTLAPGAQPRHRFVERHGFAGTDLLERVIERCMELFAFRVAQPIVIVDAVHQRVSDLDALALTELE
jgi:hypothetical protein